ncbi:hypothetical protein R5R35_006453 [Gryllus longicercus]|uniref:Trafficking protein particle complex subunit 11 n=2 Tax=Gryllus longicercus TaxID=2509291 RepID=A0AAN9VUV9_9ORTH
MFLTDDNLLTMSAVPSGFDFPSELSTKPFALIGLTGLDTLNNAIHRTIWDAFSNNRRSDRAPVHFKLLGPAHEFPPPKAKRNTYEWYIPKGILKRNWMNKHLNEIPAVVAIFYELDWEDPQWNEKRIECASRVQSMRVALAGRNTRIAVVLIQQTAPLPTGEDMTAAERATALCTSCELNAKSLFVLPHGDHLHGYTVRLENVFYDLALNYYHHEARNVKSHRDQLNKTTHQYLFVRHQLKIGFLNELKQDSHTAQKHYLQAYNNLLEVRIVDTNNLEVKTVAGFINYKLCKLMFQQNLPRDAINQFRQHIEMFRNCIGPKDLAFEHCAWMSKQFSVFGDIFDEAIRQGLPALQTQHPGFYYQQAAQNAIERKTSCQELCKSVTEYPNPDPLMGAENLEFYGQRPWRPGKLSAEPPDPAKEKIGVLALQYKEKNTNHSMLIIGLLGSAISQFKTYRCPRMRRQLVVQMAEEYFSSQDYGKALTLLTHMLWDYRCEKWWLLLSNILVRALGCAFLAASVQDYVVLSLEALGSCAQLHEEEKTRVFGNLERLLKGLPPDPEPNLPQEEVDHARQLWTSSKVGDVFNIAIEMNNITGCIESKAQFTQPQYQADQHVTIEVYIRSCCPHPLQFSKLTVTVNNPTYSSEFAVCESSSNESGANPLLLFHKNEVKRFVCQFLPDVQDVGKEIQIGSILLYLGSEKGRCAILRFTGTGSEPSSVDISCPELQHFRPSSADMPDFDGIQPVATAEIVPRDSKLEVTVVHSTPALLGEWYPIKVILENKESNMISEMSMDINLLSNNEDPSLEQATQICESISDHIVSLPLKISVGNLDPNCNIQKLFYMRGHRIGNRNIMIKVSYNLSVGQDGLDNNNSCIKETTVMIPVVKPFDITAKFFSLKFEPIAKSFAKEPFVVMPHVSCVSPCSLVIENSSIELSGHIKSVDDEVKSQLKLISLKNGETGTEAYCVTADQANDQPVALGIYTLQWRREDTPELVTSSSVTLPTVRVESAPLFIEMCLPAHGWVRTPMAVSYHIRNHTTCLLDLELNMEASDAFMFAGHKQLQLRILPESVKTLDYNLYPLLSGLVALPRLRLTISDKNDYPVKQPQLTELLDRSLPSHVYVMPQGKGNPTPIAIPS